MVIGLDIGGANLKAAHASGIARTLSFALWKEPHRLVDKLRELLDALPPADVLAVTMSGELCDCFTGKEHGVRTILDAVREAAGTRRVDVWTNRGCFVDLDQAHGDFLAVAAANWLALAHAVAPAEEPGLLIDIGSTTTDIVPLVAGRPAPRGIYDPDRLKAKELVYCGVRRTPLCAVLGLDNAAEWFATTFDVFLTLGMIPEDATDTGTADGRPATRPAAHARLAHMLCGDAQTCSTATTLALAERALRIVLDHLADAVAQVIEAMPTPPRAFILSGSGEFLARQVVDTIGLPKISAKVLLLSELWGPMLSEAACAYALVKLARRASEGVPSLARRANRSTVVVKVSGSLLDLPDLRERLTRWLGSLENRNVILVPGGGPLVDAIRSYDRLHGLGEEASHWLALRSASVNAHLLAQLLPGTPIIGDVDLRPPGRLAILDVHAFARADEARQGCLPHRWEATNDSFAVRAAIVAGTNELVLLKSVDVPAKTSWQDAARLGMVDPLFAQLLPADMNVRIVNLRSAINCG